MSEGGEQSKPAGAQSRLELGSAATIPSDPDVAASAQTLAANPSAASAGRVVRKGHEVLGDRYEILGELGRGGEGVVYRARDLKADAVVALKFFQQDEGSRRLDRLRRELQMARKVSHPNVVRIHDLVELPERFGLSMEIVEGESLEARLARGPLPDEEVTRIAREVADALAAAHAAGVTHRDLKPANVLLRATDGRAMVTDFGVSRLHAATTAPVEPHTTLEATTVKLTREGALIGTPQYMAPEQLEGRSDIGPRADVYAWGALVYEAATGGPPHDATTLDGLRSQKATPAPPLRRRRRQLPRDVTAAVDRALATRPEDRFADGGALVEALARGRRAATLGRLGLGLVVALGVGALGATVALRGRSSTVVAAAPARPFHIGDAHRLTFGSGCEEFPSFTPDGRSIAYDGQVGEDSVVYLLDLAPGSKPRAVTSATGWDIAPRVSPRGDAVAFLRLDPELGAATYVAPLDGSSPPRRFAEGTSRPTWSRDGRGVWVVQGSRFIERDANTGEVIREYDSARENLNATLMRELPDGRVVALMAPLDHGYELGLVSPSGLTVLVHGALGQFLATEASGEVLVGRAPKSGGMQLLAVPLDGGPPALLGSEEVGARAGLDVSPDGSRVVWSTCAPTTRLSVVGGDSSSLPGLLTEPQPAITYLAAAPSVRRIAMTSARGGPAEVWVIDGEGWETRRLPDDVNPSGLVGMSADGERLAFSARDRGIFVVPLSRDDPPRQLTRERDDEMPSFRFDGEHVVFTQHRGGTARVMQVALGGGPEEPLLEPGSRMAIASPTDGRVAYLTGEGAEAAVMLWDEQSHSSRPLSRDLARGRPYGRLAYSLDGRRVAVVVGSKEIVEIDVESGAIARTWKPAPGESIHGPAYTPFGLVVNLASWAGSLWLGNSSR